MALLLVGLAEFSPLEVFNGLCGLWAPFAGLVASSEHIKSVWKTSEADEH